MIMLIVNAFTGPAERGWRCPSSEKLAAYIDGSMSSEHRRALERHLADCNYCLELVAGEVSEVRQTAPATPTWLRQRAEDQAGRAKSKNRRWAWVLAPVLTGLVTVALLVKSPGHLKEEGPREGPNNPPAVTAPQSSPSTTIQPAEPTRSAEGQTKSLRLIVPSMGAASRASQLRFVWTAIPNASYYQVRLMTEEGQLVWEERLDQANVRPPSALKIAPGNYFVWVTAYLNDGRELQAAPTRFQVLAER
jgi:Putative zinc-finger